MNKAFSLVELSIVLVILGLLTGGILAGQNLIRAAELRSVSNDVQRYTTALYTFRDKYFSFPGDMPNAVKFWGAQAGTTADGVNTTCAALTAAATTQATCNGNGNGIVGASGTEGYERFRAWQHLANAGLIEGAYTGIAVGGTASGNTVDIGLNSPRARISNAGFGIQHAIVGNAPTHFFDNMVGNYFMFGGNDSSGPNYGAVISNEEAWNIDTKMDDGLPAQGTVFGWKTSSTIIPNCSNGTTDAATYDLTRAGNACSLFFLFAR